MGNREILSAMERLVVPGTQLKVICNEDSLVILRLDNRSLESLKARLGLPFIVKCGDVYLRSLKASGTIQKAKKKIKSQMPF